MTLRCFSVRQAEATEKIGPPACFRFSLWEAFCTKNARTSPCFFDDFARILPRGRRRYAQKKGGKYAIYGEGRPHIADGPRFCKTCTVVKSHV